jgi:hypothetical protein
VKFFHHWSNCHKNVSRKAIKTTEEPETENFTWKLSIYVSILFVEHKIPGLAAYFPGLRVLLSARAQWSGNP